MPDIGSDTPEISVRASYFWPKVAESGLKALH